MDSIPPQSTFILNLVRIDHQQAVLTNVEGEEVVVCLSFESKAKATRASSDGTLRTVYPGLKFTIKDLGVAARTEMGLSPHPPLDVSTRVIQGHMVLPMHKPLATMVPVTSFDIARAYGDCHFCKEPMGYDVQGFGFEGPFTDCYFCGDAPAWHHGACCPHNCRSSFYRGVTHKERYRKMINLRRSWNGPKGRSRTTNAGN